MNLSAGVKPIRTHNPRPIPIKEPIPTGDDARSIERRMSMAWWDKHQWRNMVAAMDTGQYLSAVLVYGNAREGYGNDLSRLRPTEEREGAWIQECDTTLRFWAAWGDSTTQAEMIDDGWRLVNRQSGQRLFLWTTYEQLVAYREELDARHR